MTREKITVYRFTRGGWYVTSSAAQNKSSFLCHFPMYFPTDTRDSTIIGKDLASPYEAGKWPLTLIGPLVKNNDNLQAHVLECHWLMKVTTTLEPEHFQHPSDCLPQHFQHWLRLREKALVIQNPNCCDGNRQLHQHLPNLPRPVNHNILRPLRGSSEIKTL